MSESIGVHIAQIHARTTAKASEQLEAAAGETHLVGGGDARDLRWSDIAAPLVAAASVELAPIEREYAGGAVEGVTSLVLNADLSILEGHREGIAIDRVTVDGEVVEAVTRRRRAVIGDGDIVTALVVVRSIVCKRGGSSDGHILGQGEREHARKVAWLVLALVIAGIVAIDVVRVECGAHAANQRGAA